MSAVGRATQERLSPRMFAFYGFVAGMTYAVTKEAVKEVTKEAAKEDAPQSVKPQHVETVKKKTGSKPKIAALSTQAAKQVFSLPPSSLRPPHKRQPCYLPHKHLLPPSQTPSTTLTNTILATFLPTCTLEGRRV